MLSDIFEIDVSATLQLLTDCLITYQMCSDIDCKNVLPTHSHLKLTQTNYEIEKTEPLKKSDLYIAAMGASGLKVLATLKFDILICGYEIISTPKGNEIT